MSGQDYMFTHDEPLSEEEHLMLANYAPQPRHSHNKNISTKLKKQRKYFDSPDWVLSSVHPKPEEGAHQNGSPHSFRQGISGAYAPVPEGSNVGDSVIRETAQNGSLGYEMTGGPLTAENNLDLFTIDDPQQGL